MPQKDPLYKTIKQKDLVRILKDNYTNESDTRFTFLFGAGTSVQSGIPAATHLSNQWIQEIQEDNDEDEYKSWIKDNKIDVKHPAKNYSKIYQKRFEHNHKNGYECLQKIMDDKQPSIGYSILSQILVETKHNFVITTNFDSLIEDALFLFTAKRPLVCGHESLSNFIKLNSTRPTIIKVHRDILLNPYNQPNNTSSLEDSLKKALKPILSNSPLIIIGYGGNDESIMNFLKDSQRENIYWCIRNIEEIPSNITKILRTDDKIVQIEGFDELMVALHANVYHFESINTLKLENPNHSLIVKNALKKVDIYKKQLESFEKEVESSTSNEFKEDSKAILPDWWEYELDAQQEKNISKKEEIYKKGLKDNPTSQELLGLYAIFLKKYKKDFDEAETYYKKALSIKPEGSHNNGNYALFLSEIKKDFVEAEIYYKNAIRFEPNNALINGNYAIFLNENKKDFDEAEIYYKNSLNIDPYNANVNGNYANFLRMSRKNFVDAEIYYKKALEIDPNNANNNGNYALFLSDSIHDFDKANKYYIQSVMIEPNNSNFNGNYAFFLSDMKKDFDKAEIYYEKSLKLEPDNANVHDNYAYFLNHIRKNFDQAQSHYLEALNFEINNANINGNYAGFLLSHNQKTKANKYINIAFKKAGNHKDLLCELWFYKLTHYEKEYRNAKNELDLLLKDGHQSYNWDFSLNIKQAIKEKHSHINILKDYAFKISGIKY